MHNILKIIASDIKRLTVNVVAIVVIIGLSVIPCLYAWFNILSNWDPYGESSTGNLQVAVASDDQGMVIAGYELNVGDKIISNLKENKTIGWVFTDTSDEAIDGVHSGDYYAALVIDEDFSQNLVSFLGGNIENPTIVYYENEKKNAIAPKITSKVKTTVQKEVDQAFISTIANVLLESSEFLVEVDDDGSLSGAAITKLESLDSDLNGVILILESYISLMDSSEQLMKSGEAVSDSVDSMMESASAMAVGADAAASAATTSVNSMSGVMDTSLDTIDNELDYIYDILDSKLDPSDFTYLGKSAGAARTITKSATKLWNSLDTSTLVTVKSNVDAVTKELDSLDANLADLETAAGKTDEDIQKILKVCKEDISNCKSSIDTLKKAYNTKLEPQLETTMSSVDSSITQIESILKYRTTTIDSVAKSLHSYPDMMSQSKDSLQKSLDEATEMEAKLSQMIQDMKDVENSDQYGNIVSLIESDPEFLADFIANPVNISEEYVYPVDTNGSGTSPFYIVLSIWVGSLIMSTILKTVVKDKSELNNPKNWQCFIGRYFTTWAIGQIQTIITVLGAILYVGIQCEHPFLFWVACAWTSTVFSLLLYSFTYAFGNVGEALSVVLMVIQVAGSGGTFPIEVLPKVFQYLYALMPFKYAMTALKECIAGMYKYDYILNLLALVPFVILAFVNGLFFYFPMKRLNEQIEKSKEKSGILI